MGMILALQNPYNMIFPRLEQRHDNFSDANVLGQGGFGPVYRVIKLTYRCMSLTSIVQIFFPSLVETRILVIIHNIFNIMFQGKLQNGKQTAVKRLSADSGQGDLEFKTRFCWLPNFNTGIWSICWDFV